MKLLVVPALTAGLAFWVFDLAPMTAGVAIVLAALPTGTGSYMVADFYKRDAVTTSQVILLSTVGSVVTLTILAMLLPLVS